jgi:adenosyl cobinamide kinase/adenosyl cobinamide phosphate guanylyltransferase
MTSTQSFKIYEILQKHFNNSDDAKIIVQEIEQIVENKLESKKDVLSTKEDLLTAKQDLIDRINTAKMQTIIWIVGVGVLQFIAFLLTRKLI